MEMCINRILAKLQYIYKITNLQSTDLQYSVFPRNTVKTVMVQNSRGHYSQRIQSRLLSSTLKGSTVALHLEKVLKNGKIAHSEKQSPVDMTLSKYIRV